MPPNSSLKDAKFLDDNHHTHDSNGLVTRKFLRERSLKDDWNCLDHIIWPNVFWFSLLHVASVYGLYLTFTQTKILTILFAIFVYNVSLFGITAGVHRLWSHKAYKANLAFKIILAFCNSIAYQNSILVWARDHRVHHKYSETNADPVNIERGFFFAHMGWLLCKKHPDVTKFGSRIDLSDLIADKVVYYQHKYYIPSVILMCFILPTLIPVYFWNESIWVSFFVCTILRYTFALNSTWLVNSAAHMYGNRPYDINIAPTENISVAALTLGEGYHNYHHTFPFDYSTSEWGWNVNLTTFILDSLAKIGWVYDRRMASPETIRNRIARTGNPNKYQEQEPDYC